MAELNLKSHAEIKAEEAQKLKAFAGLSLRHFRGQIEEALSYFGSFGFLEEYTKHDISHIDSMLEIYDWLIPEKTKEIMTPADWLLITLATYLHDFGLIITRDEFDARKNVVKYQSFRSRIINNDDPTMRDYRSEVERLSEESGEKFMYQEFVRYYHAERIRNWLQESPALIWGGDQRVVERLGALLNELEETFREDIGLVCESHHLDDMNDLLKYPLSKPYGSTSQEEANVQYAALLLRTSDLLHMTNDRVPAMAALIINPRNPKSQVEWSKQSAVKRVRAQPPVRNADGGEETEQIETIEVHANFKHAEGYFGLTGYLQYALKQLQQTYEWSKENQTNGVSDFTFPWRKIDQTNIKAKGFVTKQFTFSIDQAKILDLLTGHTLYNDTGVVVRELVQNSLDAVRLQRHLSILKNESYTPRIDVTWDSVERVFTVTDNGVGMSQAVIEKNFLHVGSSRYQEPEFKKEYPDFASISRFGIGVLSTFMVADDVTVTTVHESESEARKLSLRDVHGQYLVRLLERQGEGVVDQIRDHGTSVSMKLRPSAELKKVEDVLREWIVLPGCDVYLAVDDAAAMPIGFSTVSDALLEILTDAELIRTEKGVTKTRFGSLVEIRTATVQGLEIAFAVSWNEWLQDWGYVRLEPDRADHLGVQSVKLGVCIGGVRVTNQAPGFVFGGIASLANATGKTAPRTNVARSAIEKTDEYDLMLEQIYEAYVGHIVTELRELEEKRASSLTRAVQEASFLAEDLARAEPESISLRDQKLRTVPGIVVEEAGTRKAYSLDELSAHETLSSMESTTIASFEAVLRSVRGSSSPSLSNLIAAMGSDEVLPEAPLICGMNRSGLISNMFAAEWEITRLETDSAGRMLKASWKRKGAEPRWSAPDRRSALPTSMLARMDQDYSFGRMGARVNRTLLPSKAEEIELIGFEKKKIVLCQGWLLILPGHSMLEIKAANEDVSETARLWCISWLVSSFGAGGRSPSGRVLGAPADHDGRGAQWQSSMLDSIRGSGVFEILDENSARSALIGADLEPLDVLRWDKRSSPE